MEAYTVREARENDCEEIFRLILELARFEQMTDQVKMDSETLKKDGFGHDRLFQCLVAETTDNHSKGVDAKLVGYLLYYWSYSTWTGRTLFVEDVYVSAEHRRKGVASAMWKRAVEIALRMGCQRMQWSVLEWNNSAINFYKKMGAVDMYAKEGWRGFRLTTDDLQSASSLY